MPDLSATTTIALNRSERMYLALEGVVGSVTQLIVMRLETGVSREAMRTAVRDVVRAYPRLRTVVEPTLFSHRLRVLDDGDIDQLFDDAFRVVTHVSSDPASLEGYVAELVNEPFALERGLPIRLRYVANGPHPALILMVHHVVCDGRSVMMTVEAIMRALNGKLVEPLAIDAPTMLPAVLPTGFGARLASVWRSFRDQRAQARAMRGRRVTRFGSLDATRFGVVGVRLHVLPVGMDELKRASIARGCTVTALVLAALVEAFGRRVNGEDEAGRDAVAIRLSVDLRKYFPKGRAPTFGNYVGTFLVYAGAVDAGRALATVSAQMREGLERFERKLMSYPLLLAELYAAIGRKMFALAAIASKRKGTLPAMTCHYSNLGNLDGLNAKDATVRLFGLLATAPNVGPFVVTSGLGDSLAVTLSYGKNEATDAEVYALLERLDDAIRAIAREATPTAIDADLVRIAS